MAMTAADMIVHVGADTKDAESGLSRVGSSIDRQGASSAKAGLAMGGMAAAVGAGFGFAVNSAMNFEGAMADVSASLGTTGQEYTQLSDLALKIGADTAFSATQGAQAIEELGKAGVSITDILSGAGMSAAQLASATGTDIPTAAGVMSNAMNAFSLSGAESTRVADVMTAALNESSLNMNDFANGMASAGTIAASLGIPIEDVAGSLAIFSNYGMSGADAGTSLRTMLTRLASPTEEASTLMGELGISAFDASGEFVGMSAFAENLKTSLAGMTDQQRMAALETIFGADAQRVANILYQEGAAGVDAMTGKMQSNGQAAEASNRRMAGLRGAMEQLGGSVETMSIMFGQLLTPALNKFAKIATKAVNWISNLSKPIKGVVVAFVGFMGIVAGLGAAIAALAGPFAGTGAIIGTLLGTFGAIIGVMALVAAGAYVIYRVFGDDIARAIQSVTNWLDPLIFRFRQVWLLLSQVATNTGVGAMAFALLPEAIQPAVRQIMRLVDAFQVLVSAYQSGGFSGLLDALPGQLSRMGDAFGKLGMIILDALVGLDWAGIGSAVLNGLTSALSALAGIAGTILGYLGDLAGALASWLWEQASAVDWAGLLSSAAALAGDIASVIVSKLGDLTAAIGGWLSEKAGAVDWAGILSTAAGKAGNIVSVIVTKLGDLATGLKTWYDNAINSVDWASMGTTVGTKVGDLTRTLAPKAAELIRGVTDWLTNNWSIIGTVLLGLFLGLPALIGYIGLTLAPKALEFIQGFITGLNINWSAVTAWLSLVPSLLLGAIGSLATTLLSKGLELVQGLLSGLNQQWPTITAWLSLVGSLALSAIGSLVTTLLPKGLELLQGILTGLNQQWPTIMAWLSLVGSLALSAIGSLATTLLSKGVELLTGIWSGLNQQWPTIVAWLGLVGSLALAAIGSLATTLLNSGVELITGIWSGLNQHWPTVVAWLGLVGSLAIAAIGSLATTLLGKGRELIQGAYEGLLDRWPNVAAWLGRVGAMALQAVGSLASTLLSRGVELITGIVSGLNNKWPTVVAWLGLVGSLALAAVGNLASTLLSRGSELISGILSGLNASWPTVSSWLSMVGSLAVSAVGDLGYTLWSAGWSLISGMASGITAAGQTVIDAAQGVVNSVIDILSNIPGFSPIEHVGLYYGGKLGFGFAEGIAQAIKPAGQSATALVGRAIDQLDRVISPQGAYAQGSAFGGHLAGAGMPAGQTINYTDQRTFTVKVDDLAEVAQAAELIRDLQRDHELVYGAR